MSSVVVERVRKSQREGEGKNEPKVRPAAVQTLGVHSVSLPLQIPGARGVGSGSLDVLSVRELG